MSFPSRGRTVALSISCLAVLAWTSGGGAEPERVAVEDALSHEGENVTVCGRVVETSYLPHLRGQPTYLNLERPYPHPAFTVVVWGQHRPAFPEGPEETYRNQVICVTGVIQRYRDWPRVEARTPDAIRVIDAGLTVDRFGPEERAVIQATLRALGYGSDDDATWSEDTDRALASFVSDRGVPMDGDGWSPTLRALAEETATLTGDQGSGIVRGFLLDLARREAELAP